MYSQNSFCALLRRLQGNRKPLMIHIYKPKLTRNAGYLGDSYHLLNGAAPGRLGAAHIKKVCSAPGPRLDLLCDLPSPSSLNDTPHMYLQSSRYECSQRYIRFNVIMTTEACFCFLPLHFHILIITPSSLRETLLWKN